MAEIVKDAQAWGANGPIKPSHKGLLHKDLHVPQGQNIPQAKIEKAAHSPNVKLAERARFAEAAEHWAKK